MKRKIGTTEEANAKRRKTVHLIFTGIFMLMVMVFKWMNNKEIISILLDIAGYTYGPLLGLFAFGILTKRQINDRLTPVVCIAAPIISFVLDKTSVYWLGGYKFGVEMLVINGLFTFAGLMMIHKKQDRQQSPVSVVK